MFGLEKWNCIWSLTSSCSEYKKKNLQILFPRKNILRSGPKNSKALCALTFFIIFIKYDAFTLYVKDMALILQSQNVLFISVWVTLPATLLILSISTLMMMQSLTLLIYVTFR